MVEFAPSYPVGRHFRQMEPNIKMLNLNPQLMKFRLYDVRKRSKVGKHVYIAQREKDVLLDLNRD